MPCPSTDHLAEILDDLYKNPKKLNATAELCYERALQKQFTWEVIGAQFAGIFEDAIKGVDHSVKKVSPSKKVRKKRKIGNA